MNVVDTLQHEIDLLDAQEKPLSKRFEEVDSIPWDQLTDKESAEWEALHRALHNIWARQRQLEDELAAARKRQHSQHRAYRATHPTLADIWPKRVSRVP